MSALTAAIAARLQADATLAAMLASYNGLPAVFTVDPAPDDADLPYIVAAGEISQTPFDTKTTRGREVTRDVRCYAEASDSAALIEAIAERVRELFHRQRLAVSGYENWVISCNGPRVADETDAYGRIVGLRLILMESDES